MAQIFDDSTIFGNFYAEVDNFCAYRINETRLSILINSGLNVFLSLPVANYTALYLMNQETFELDFTAVEPQSYDNEINDKFREFVECGIIGNTLRSGKINFMNLDNKTKKFNDSFIICPLMTARGVLGLVFLSIGVNPQEFNQTSMKMIYYFSHLFSSTLDNLMMFENKLKIQELLDQLVASRTIRLIESKNQLGEKIEHLKSNLSMAIPHEVRTPINQILGFSDFLSKNFKTTSFEDGKEMLDDIHTSAVRLKRLFENYLYYANLSVIATDVLDIQALQNQFTISSESVIIDKVLTKAQENDRKETVKLELIDAPIKISEEFFGKIIEEIFDNCIKYSDVDSQIIVKTEIVDTKYVMSFTDYGRGMSDEQIQKIDAYMQFERKVYEQQGSGLGLSIVTKILDIIGAEMKITSNPNEGTKITIYFDLATEDDIDAMI